MKKYNYLVITIVDHLVDNMQTFGSIAQAQDAFKEEVLAYFNVDDKKVLKSLVDKGVASGGDASVNLVTIQL